MVVTVPRQMSVTNSGWSPNSTRSVTSDIKLTFLVYSKKKLCRHRVKNDQIRGKSGRWWQTRVLTNPYI